MHPLRKPGFWITFAGKISPPMFGATLVGCILNGKFEPIHGVLLAIAFSLIWLNHWYVELRK